jgi:ribosomal protein S18 acetylase RimI-like enzyme
VAFELRVVSPEWEESLADFFAVILMSGEKYFHPHPFTPESAKAIAQHCGEDLYYVLVDGKTVLAYGILRGWDQGYEIPSLGIAVHPEARGGKLGELMMHFLHSAARRKGARQIRLKVYSGNASARTLYAKLGYKFDSVEEEGQLIGRLEL